MSQIEETHPEILEEERLDSQKRITEKISMDEKILFWGINPNALFAPEHILELFPVPNMSYEQKLNAVTRTVIILILLFYFALRTWRVVIIGVFTVFAIWLIHYSQKNPKKNVRFADKEGFMGSSPAEDFVQKHLLPKNIFSEATETNPLQNVMLNDYDNPSSKKPATAAYTQDSQTQILEQTKRMIDEAHPGQPNLTDKLFQGLGDSLAFEQSMRPFYSTANTTIPNDQGAFADFCYGGMVSCKEGNSFACARNLSRHVN
jgi:hypothetical protein